MSPVSKAEDRYRDAFTRLKEGRPVVLAEGSTASQNNVALEAGRHPSALRKERFPQLVAEIQGYCGEIEKATVAAEASSKPDEILKLKAVIALLKKKQEFEASRVLSLLLEVAHLKKELAGAKKSASVTQI